MVMVMVMMMVMLMVMLTTVEIKGEIRLQGYKWLSGQ